MSTCPVRPGAGSLCTLLLGALLLGVRLTATPQATLDLLYATQHYGEVALSPDGARLAWVEERPNADRTPSRHTALYVLDAPGAAPRRVTAGDGIQLHAETGAAWSPDGRQLAFLSDAAKDGQPQLCLVSAGGGPVRTLTKLDGHSTRPRWSPDGRTIALLHIAGSHAPAGAVEAAPRDSGEVAARIDEQRLVLVDTATGAVRPVTPEDTYVYEFDWSPDSRRLAYTAARGSGDNNWWIARLYTVDAEGGAPNEIHRPERQIAVPRWSPDGASIAFISGLMSDAGLNGGDLWLVPAAGGPARNLTPGRDATPAWLHWTAPGRLLFTEWRQGGTAIAHLDTATGRTELVWQGDETLEAGGDILSLTVADDGIRSAAIRSSFDRPPEVWAGPLGRWNQVTHANDGRRAPWGRTEKVTWRNEGRDVQGWLLRPAQVDPARQYPLIVSVHGGPAGQLTPRWPRASFNLTMMAAEGYFVFFPNPRGSFGQGEAFTQGNVRDFGLGDLRDILTGLDAVLRTEPVDGQRLGLGGWSYGGYMTMWALTQTQRFRAAVAGAGIANWQSYYGQNLIDQWMIPFFGASVYDDPAVYARSSPINFINQVRTPTLIVAGDSDKECPAPQSYEYWHALRARGVPTSLVIYEGEGHHFRDPAHVQDLLTRTLNWYDDHLRR